MNTPAYLIVTVLVAIPVYLGIRWVVRAYSRYRGNKLVICPETGRPTIVEIDALHASFTSTVGPPDIRLQDCSRWPGKAECGQECLVTLDVAPGQCLVSGVLMRWYRGRKCCYCGKPIEDLHWIDHKPALLSPEGLLVKWSGVLIEDISTVLNTHLPVCWNCYIVQSFRREHPDLVVYRPGQNGITGGAGGSSAPRHL